MKRLLILVPFVIGWCATDLIIGATSKTDPLIPAELLAAIAACEADRAAVTTAQAQLSAGQTALTAAQSAVLAAQDKQAAAEAKLATDTAALMAVIAKLYPPPTPPTPPVPPVPPVPPPTPTSNLRVLFLVPDPMEFSKLDPAQQQILGSTAIRAYLNAHCPLECPTGACPLASTAVKSPSYRFLQAGIDATKLEPIWQATWLAIAKRKAPWLLAVNETGTTVIDQSWPPTVDETLKLLKKFGGE